MLGILALAAALAVPALGNGLNLNGIGSRALAMGGAYVGLADDISAVFWNPAGLAAIRSRAIGAYGMDVVPRGSYKLSLLDASGTATPFIDARTARKHYVAGLVAFYLPVGRSLTAGLAVYTPSGLGAAWKGEDFSRLTMGGAYDWSSKVGLLTIAPALAWRASDAVSVGAALNFNYGSFSFKTHAGSLPSIDGGLNLGQYEESLKGWGVGATLGVQVRPHRLVSLGATVRTVSKVSFAGEASVPSLAYAGFAGACDIERDVTWPLWLAAGVAVHPGERWTLTADVQRTQWSRIDVLKTSFADPSWAALVADFAERPMRWKDATQVRLGAEYVVKPGLAVRAGYYWDPTPVPDTTMNVLLPSYDFNALTAGLGYTMDGLAVDLGFELLMGVKRTVGLAKWSSDPAYEAAMPGTYRMTLLVPNASVSYRF
jgi:long-chain fatty acid transport protein